MPDGLPAYVESEDQLPEGLADYYQQNDDGAYVLSVDGVDNHPDVKGLKSSLQKQKSDREKLRKERDQYKERASMLPEDVDQDTLDQALARIREGDTGESGQQAQQGQQGQNTGQDAAKVREQLEKRYQKEIEERDKAIQQRDQQVQKLVVEQGLQGALQKHGVTSPGLQKGAMRLLRDQVKVSEGDDGGLQAVVDTDMGEVSLDQFVKDWITTEEGQDYLPPSRGSGARGSGPNGQNGAKQMTREQFEKLSPEEKRKFAVEQRGTITG